MIEKNETTTSSPFVWYDAAKTAEIGAAIVANEGARLELHTVGEKVYVHIVLGDLVTVLNDSHICPIDCPW